MAGARQVREEDRFDVEKVARWLRENTADQAGLDGVPEVEQFSAGASNLTFLLRYPDRELILRHGPRGTKARGAHDMSREYRIQSRIAGEFPYVPGLVAFCDDPEVLGVDFYVMNRISGVIPGREWPSGVPLSTEQANALCHNFVDVLAQLHSIDVEAAGLGDLGKGIGYVSRQVDGWSSRYRNARTDDVGDFEAIMAWLAEHQPEDVRNCLIHNDFKLDNVVLNREDVTRVIGVLDWEMATLGDPLMDLAGSLAYWVQADDADDFQLMRRVPTHLPGMMTRAEVVEYYCERMGFEMTPERWRWYEVFGLFRLAVIAQQIYYRFFHGQTTNEAFALLGAAVNIVESRITAMIAQR